MKPMSSVGNLVPVLMATLSVISIIAAFQLDAIVNKDLYAYGLQFSSDWGIPYWIAIRTIFAVAWLNIIMAIALQIHLRTRKTEGKVRERGETKPAGEERWTGELRDEKLENKEHWHIYKLSDGSTIKVKHKLKSAKRLEKYSPDGIPIYVVDYDNIVQVVSVPEKLTERLKEPPASPDKPLKQEKKEAIQMFAASSSDFEQTEEQKEPEIVVSKGRKQRKKKTKQKH
jgi:hypothetical protein